MILHCTKKLYAKLPENVKVAEPATSAIGTHSLFKSWFVHFDLVMDNALAASKPILEKLAHRVEIRKKAHAFPDLQPLPEHIRNLFPSELEQTGEPTVGIEGKEGISDTVIYFLTRYQVSGLQKRSHGSVFNIITRESFKTLNLAFGGEKLTLSFESLVKPYLHKILQNNRQILELTKTKDVLLPKLIPGVIKLNKEVE
ncbi:hypothetical protein RJ44_02015 [Alteromonas macleodii]|uniref:hypothetical protein n=1 Tax=Alteromonas macleodii TaxID=28108 RepID=UPI00057CE9D3|nr:hypothetical protein [Alteromonas macleodii]KHT61022.1 hypothetical protein RJ44_02015 [Alteromonas macleodii]